MINDFYKLYQLAEVFIVRYGFEQRLIRKYGNFMAVELWLHKRNDPNYQLIRLTTNKAEDIDKDLARIHEYINQYNSDPGDPISFLDISFPCESFFGDGYFVSVLSTAFFHPSSRCRR